MKKTFWYVVIFLLIIIAIFIGNFNDDSVDVSNDYDTAYYVEAEGNLFIKLAKLCDDASYYVVDIVLNGIESLFGILGGN